MSKVHIAPLAHLDAVLAQTQGAWLASFSAPAAAIGRPEGVAHFLALEFHDIPEPRDGLHAVSAQQVDDLIAFLQRWRGDGPLVVQCWMGVSRSTAAALIAAAIARPDVTPAALVAALRAVAPYATPNPLMVALADRALGLGGALAGAVAKAGRGATVSTAPAVVLDTGALA